MVRINGIFLNIVLGFFITLNIVSAQSTYSQSTIEKISSLKDKIRSSIEKKDSLNLARAYYKMGRELDHLGESDSAKHYYMLGLTVAKQIKNTKAIAIISNALSSIYSDAGLHKKAIDTYNKTAELLLQIGDSSAAADVSLNVSMEMSNEGKYAKALSIALNALNMKIQLKDSTNIAAYFAQIANLFDLLGNKQKREEYLLKAYSLIHKGKYASFYTKLNIYNELGGLYMEKGDINSAKKYYDSLLIASRESDYTRGISTALTNLVTILKKQNKYKSALNYAEQALHLDEQTNNRYSLIFNLVELAKLKILLNDLHSAKSHLEKAIALAKKYNYPNELASAYKVYADFEVKRNNYKQAYDFKERYQAIMDSLTSAEMQKKMAELETKYQSQRKDAQIKLLNKENQLKQAKLEAQKRTAIIIVVIFLFVVAIILLVYYQNKLKTQNRILQLNQKLLQTQMNPHFIFNALIAIQNYVIKNKKFEASDYLSKFAELMRTILQSSRKEFCSLDNEINLLKNYVSLQQLRLDNSFDFEFIIGENIQPENLQIPPMIIQPFVENAIEHGLRKCTAEDKKLIIRYELVADNFEIFVEDNGLGINNITEKENLKKHQSYAMEITKERLTNITKLFKRKIEIYIRDLSEISNKRGTQVQIIIPYKLMVKSD